MTIHEDALSAFQAVYDERIAELEAIVEHLESSLEIADDELELIRTDKAALVAEVERLLLKIAELEAEPEDDVPEGWAVLYDSTFTVDDGWEKRQETQSNDNSYNTPKNVEFGDRGMVLYSKRETLGGRPYTSADVLGRHIPTPNYFRAEVTATAPTAYGQWPCALWFRPLNGGDSGEIDVMETWPFDWNGVPRMYSTIWENYTTKRKENARLDYSKLPNPDPAAPHTYAVEKVKDRITFSVDGVTVYSWEKPKMNATLRSWYDSVYEVAGREWYPRITMQVGGPNAKEPKPEWVQSEMVIHRLRIFKEA